ARAPPAPAGPGGGGGAPHPRPPPRRRVVLAAGGAGAAVLAGGILLSRCRPGAGPRATPTLSATGASPSTGGTGDSEQFRPDYHYSPPQGHLADPNGLVLYDDEYHLFHQQDGTWAHAVSPDMVRWTTLGTALEHDSLGLAMSGSCVVDGANTSGLVPGGGLIAVYTSTEGGEAQSLAYSGDRGRSWQRYADNPVIPNDGATDFRDPKVFWHEDSGAWVMVVSAGDHVRIYRSADLIGWEHASDFGQGFGSHAAVWECPDLFPLTDGSTGETRWVMTLSVGANEETGGSTAQYFIGDFDGRSYVPEDELIRFTDAGQDFYAAQSFEHVEGRRIWLAWMGNWDYPYSLPTGDWRGEMSIPRELSLGTRDGTRTLLQSPVPELDSLRGEALDISGLSATDGVTDLGTGRVVEIDLVLDVSQAEQAWLSLARGEVGGDLEEVRVGVDLVAGVLFLDRTDGGLGRIEGGQDGEEVDFALRREVGYRPVDGRVRLHVYLDRSSLEVFVDDGAPVGTFLVFTDPGAQGLALGATGTAHIVSGALTSLSAVL
ncbi:MAG: glycoside hydrolase family 32 protein, partial [Actinomyces sp.]|uniref:glycoside hydrolase family 32 protein n=1 Tax=Actinomyces sp. TaxID=29317 RepID=UPI0026DD74C4